MNRIILSAKIVMTVLLLASCSGRHKTSSTSFDGEETNLTYAEEIAIKKGDDYNMAIIRNPWDTTRILHTYILVDKNKPIPQNLPEGTVVRTPISKAIIYSSVHASLFDELEAFNAIAGVCDLNYIRLGKIHQACRNGDIADLGDGMSPNIEKIIDIHPDAILLSPFENSGGYGRIDKLNIPIIECADYMETSALGRAEWIKFYGMLTGKEKKD
jgi:Periplasmic binding protein.